MVVRGVAFFLFFFLLQADMHAWRLSLLFWLVIRIRESVKPGFSAFLRGVRAMNPRLSTPGSKPITQMMVVVVTR